MPSAESRDDAEKALELAAAASTKAFLERTLAAARDALRTGAHTRVQPVIALGTLLGWWTSEVDDRIVTAIRGAWTDAFSVTGPDAAASVSSRADAMAFV